MNNFLKKIKIIQFVNRFFDKKNIILILIQDINGWSIYDSLYKSLKKDKRFKVLVILIHSRQPGQYGDFRLNDYNEKFLKKQKINYIKAYDERKNKWLKLEKFNPNFIFIQTPYDCQRCEQYYIDNLNKIARTCYIPYGFMIAAIQRMQFNLDFHHKCDLIFCESHIHKSLFQKYCEIPKEILQKKLIVTGYPKLDFFREKNNIDESKFWKISKLQNPQIKRLIWSPHWTLKVKEHIPADDSIAFSDFHKYYKYFLNFLSCNQDVEIVLKPHPLLWSELLISEVMTEDEVLEFKNKWQSLPNASIYEKGDYFELFLTSDAILNSSVSFMAEYYPTKKPMLFMMGEKTVFNEFGEEIIKGLYVANNQQDLENFIDRVVIKRDDYMYEKRMDVMNKTIYFPQESSGEIIKDYLADYEK